jgi:co-chaperonin GroES (HSP10)
MSGDKLASGGRSATFTQAAGQNELDHDLKTQSMPYCLEHWAIDEAEYKRLCFLISRREPLPQVGRRYRIEVVADLMIPRETSEPQPIAPTVGYEGQPVGDSVLVTRVEREHSSNLVLPDSMKAKSEIGFIVAVGEKVADFKVGQMVMWDKFASHGADIELVDADGVERKLLLLKSFDILMALRKVTVSGQTAPEPSQA